MGGREFLLLSATEAARSGLVADLTGFIATRGCNVEDSRLVVLGGYAGLMVLLSGGPTERPHRVLVADQEYRDYGEVNRRLRSPDHRRVTCPNANSSSSRRRSPTASASSPS